MLRLRRGIFLGVGARPHLALIAFHCVGWCLFCAWTRQSQARKARGSNKVPLHRPRGIVFEAPHATGRSKSKAMTLGNESTGTAQPPPATRRSPTHSAAVIERQPRTTSERDHARPSVLVLSRTPLRVLVFRSQPPAGQTFILQHGRHHNPRGQRAPRPPPHRADAQARRGAQEGRPGRELLVYVALS